MQRINFALNTIPYYDGNTNALNMFINAVNSVLTLLGMIQPELDPFEMATTFLAVRSKITGKALESIKDLSISSWEELKECLLRNFADKSNSVTILNEILNVTNIKNPTLFFDIIKGKFNNFKSKMFIEEEDDVKKNAVIKFVEKLIITHYITNLNDPFRNNLATRNPQTLNAIETLIKNDLQYLKTNQPQRPMGNTYNNYNSNNHFNKNKPQAFQPKFNTNRTPYQGNDKRFNFGTPMPTRNSNFQRPEPMSIQTRQTRPQFGQRETFHHEESYDSMGQSSEINRDNILTDETTSQNNFLELGPETSKRKS